MAADDEIKSVNTDVLQNIKGVPDPITSVDDWKTNFVPQDLSPAQRDLFLQHQQSNPVPVGELSPMTYYPGLHTPINVGNYAGSEIGSTTLFAPGGSLVPVGMMDAREAAVHRAALQKLKDVEDWKKQFQSPVTKLVNIQPKLTEEYHNHLKKSWAGAMQKAGNNPALAKEYLQNDPNFNQRESSYRDLAKYGDALADQMAKDEVERKTGKFIETPSYSAAKKAVLSSVDPNSAQFKQFGDNYRKMHLEKDFADSFNEVTKNLVMNQTGNAYPVDSPEFISAYKETLKNYTPDQINAVVNHMNDIYAGSDYFTPDKNKKEVEQLMSAMQKEKSVSLHMKPNEGSGADYKYGNNDFSDEPSSLNTNIKGQAGTEGRTGSVTTTDGLTFKKPITVQLGIGQRVHFTDEGLVPSQNIGNKEAKLGKMVIVDVLNKPGSPLDGTPITKDQIEHGALVDGKRIKIDPSMVRKESMVQGNYKEKDESGQETERSFLVPTKAVENSLVKKWGKDKKVELGVPVDESYRRVNQYNLKKAEEAVTPEEKKDPLGLFK